MKQTTLLDRAREIIRTRKIRVAIAIVPIALAGTAQADSVLFNPNEPSLKNLYSGGKYGTVGQTSIPNGIRLWGDTIVDGTGLSAAASRLAEGNIEFAWSGTIDGIVHAGDVFSMIHDFDIAFQGVNGGTVSWTLDTFVYDIPFAEEDPVNTLIHTSTSSVPSPGGTFSGMVQQSFASDLNSSESYAIAWETQLNFHWNIPDISTANLLVNIPDYGSVDLSIGNAVPLPSAAWMGGVVLGGFAWVRRKTAPKLV